VADELEASLDAADIQAHLDAMSRDFRFAAAVAELGERLALASAVSLGDVLSIARSSAGMDRDRLEFVELVEGL